MSLVLQVYRGTESSFQITDLSQKTDYLVRVCAVRRKLDGSNELTGAYSPGVSFKTLEPKVQAVVNAQGALQPRIAEPKQLSDQQWAMIILLGFAVFAVIIAFTAQQIITYTNNTDGHNGTT